MAVPDLATPAVLGPLQAAGVALQRVEVVVAVKPLMFGYQVVRLGTTGEEQACGRAALVRFAQVEGYSLGEIFVERDVNHPTCALVALIAASRRNDVKAIAVPAVTDLGRFARAQELTKRRLEREARVPVLVAT